MPKRSSRQRLPAFRIWDQVNLGSGIYWRAQRETSVSTKVSGAPVMGNRNRGGVKVCAARLRSLCGAIGAIAWRGTTVARAQDAEPRSYSNTPVGLNFHIAGALHSQGKLAFDPDLSVVDANFHSNTGLLAYVRSFDFAGQSAKFDVIVPASSFAARGLVGGQPREREMAGMVVRPELGISKAVGPWTFELAPSVIFFSDNTDFFGGNNFAQAPLYAVQGHIVYTFQSGAWIALDEVYFSAAAPP
jgi:hypothetical protein